MNKIERLLLIFLIAIPIIVKANTIRKTYEETKIHANNYMDQFSTKDRYFLDNPNIYGFSSNGKVVSNSDFTSGGLISSYEFNASIIGNKSYLSGGKEYWTQTSNGSDMFYIDVSLRSKSPQSSSGVRVTSFAKPDSIVTGKGTFSEPWEFLESYNVNIKKNTMIDGLNISVSPISVEAGKDATVKITEIPEIEYSAKDDCNLIYIKNESKYVKIYKTQKLHSDLNCVANFQDRRTIVKYNCGDNASNAPTDQSIVYNTQYKISDLQCNKAGYTQTGWKSKDGSIWSKSPLVSGTFKYESGEKGIENNTLNLTAVYTLKKPSIATIGGAATKIYGSSDTILTCSTNEYSADTKIYYSFGYAKENKGKVNNWSEYTNQNTFKVGSSTYVGDRYYSCRVYIEYNGSKTNVVTSKPAINQLVRYNNSKIIFDANGGKISGKQELYTRINQKKIFTGIRNSTVATLPGAMKAGNSFDGWYTEASGGIQVISADKKVLETFTTTDDITLYAHYKSCTAGKYNDGSTVSCKKCDSNYFSNEGANKCKECKWTEEYINTKQKQQYRYKGYKDVKKTTFTHSNSGVYTGTPSGGGGCSAGYVNDDGTVCDVECYTTCEEGVCNQPGASGEFRLLYHCKYTATVCGGSFGDWGEKQNIECNSQSRTVYCHID